jgi:hypothetical protein
MLLLQNIVLKLRLKNVALTAPKETPQYTLQKTGISFSS